MQILIATREKNVSDDLQNLIVSVGEVGWFEDFEHLCSPGFVSPCFLFLVPSM